jgi:CheY-like chemotaxis protein
MTRVLIVDDHPIVREGLVAALHGKGDIEVVGGFGSAEEAIAAAARLKPDVVILDLELPGISGIDAIARFSAPVLMLTAYGTDDEIVRTESAQRVLGQRLDGALGAQLRFARALPEAEDGRHGEDDQRHADRSCEGQPGGEPLAGGRCGHGSKADDVGTLPGGSVDRCARARRGRG